MVTVNRKQTYISTPYRVHISQWCKEKKEVINHDNAKLMNISLRREITNLEKKFVEQGLQGIKLSKKTIRGRSITAIKFFDYCKEFKWQNARISRIITFASDQLVLSDITIEFLRKYENHLREKKYAQNTINTSFKYLHRVVSQAYREKLITENPFDSFKIPRYVQTDRVYLIEEEVQKLVLLLDEPLLPQLKITLSYFLLSCYTGMRQGDWGNFNKSMIEDGYLRFRAKKNKTHVVMPIGVTLQKVLDVLVKMPAPYSNDKSNAFLKTIAAHAKINKQISTHSGRHSFGYMCASKGMTESSTAALMGLSASIVKVYFHLSGRNVTDQAAILRTL